MQYTHYTFYFTQYYSKLLKITQNYSKLLKITQLLEHHQGRIDDPFLVYRRVFASASIAVAGAGLCAPFLAFWHPF